MAFLFGISVCISIGISIVTCVGQVENTYKLQVLVLVLVVTSLGMPPSLGDNSIVEL